MSKAVFQSLSTYIEYPVEEMIRRAADFRREMQRRRTVRDFSDRPVPREIIEECLLTAGSAPSGANLQPWQFVVVSDPRVKREIRIAARLRNGWMPWRPSARMSANRSSKQLHM